MSYKQQEKQTVLIVDDMPLNIQVLANTLKDECKILVATSGNEALDIANGVLKPDLILLDVMMPNIDGYEVCRQLKGDAQTKDIPIIFVTAKGEVEDEEQGLTLGAVDYISKPFNLAIVRARVRTHLALKLKSDLLSKLTREDQLTGVANRRGFDEALERECRRCQREGLPLSLLMIDIDFFKQYNDELGHWAGDECLKKVSSILREGVHRSSDLVARYGGEEFSVMLPDTDKLAAINVAEQLRKNVLQLGLLHHVNGELCEVSVSVGVGTLLPEDMRQNCQEYLVDLADKNLYSAKAAGRNRVVADTEVEISTEPDPIS